MENYTEEELYKMWINCKRYLGTNQNQQAVDKITMIEEEWDRRMQLPNQTNQPPNVGLMRFLGYRVGTQNGMTQTHRRNVINQVMTERLPFYHSPRYMSEWGEPNTRERYLKLTSFFHGMINNATGIMEQALTEWTADLNYLKEKFDSLDSDK